jgi:hypothetical protein
MKLYRENKSVIYLSDCTAHGIVRDVLPKIVSGEVRTLMIPDLITLLSKSTKSARYGLGNEKAHFQLPREDVDMELHKQIVDKLDPIAMKVGEQFQLCGIRAK